MYNLSINEQEKKKSIHAKHTNYTKILKYKTKKITKSFKERKMKKNWRKEAIFKNRHKKQ